MGLGESKHSKATGASTGIIGMLEVVESDFSKLLSEGNAAEAMAVEEYEKLTQDNEIATTEKETAVKYKTKDSKETEAMLAGLKEDKEVASKEYDAIMDYWEKLQPMCIAKPTVRGAQEAPGGGDRGPEGGFDDPRGGGGLA